MAASLKQQRILVVVGFVIVGLAYGAQVVAIYDHSGIRNVGYEFAFGAGYTLGYGLLAWASWALLGWIEAASASGGRLTKVLRLFAVANLAFAIGLSSVTYLWAHQAISYPYDGRLSILVPTTYGLQLFGFCVVSLGFWSAGSVVRGSSEVGSSGDAPGTSDPHDIEVLV
jgi:hypothetical protein